MDDYIMDSFAIPNTECSLTRKCTGEQVQLSNPLLGDHGLPLVTSEEVATLVRESGNTRSALLLDCRNFYEFEGGHINGAIRATPEALNELFMNNRDLIRLPAFRGFLIAHAQKELSKSMIIRLVKAFRGESSSSKTSRSIEKSNCASKCESKVSFAASHRRYHKNPIEKEQIVKVFGFSEPGVCPNAKKTQILRKKENRTSKSVESSRIEFNSRLKKRKRTASGVLECSQIPPSLGSSESGIGIELIFYCEFSSVRAVDCFSDFRSADRTFNQFRFPKLSYPNVRILRGGYFEFVSMFPELCESLVGNPTKYCKMRIGFTS